MLRPSQLAYYTKKYEKQNLRFRVWLKCHADPEDLDRRFRRLHEELFAWYDCSRCRNCCKKLNGSIPEDELEEDAAYLGISVDLFKDRFLDVERGLDGEGRYQAKYLPCSFLREDGECLLGDHKPENCKDYPFTDREDRMGSLYSMLRTIRICPVAYEIWERLKWEYDF